MDGGSGLNILYACTLELLEIDRSRLRGPSGVITIESTYEHAYDCDVECIEYAEALVEAETLIVDLERLGSQLLEPKRRAGTFEPVEAVKLIPVDPACPNDRALRISATFDIK
ncbi:uncharacterized protein [Miscanthus floridulus]|uniref:uncharacterized protein n=1 Tax=Miscanthus floridulus TaxID=154761 RepID=UPI003458DFC5